MADQQPVEGSSSSNVTSGSSESTMELNIKTLDSQTHTFPVDKNMQVSALKNKIASQIGVPVEQQRLIFRGKVLKDDHVLSEYHMENGDTLHLVLRQSQSQSSLGSSSGEATTNNGNRGQEPQPTAGGSRNRVGQISHSVVLGTFNVGDQGEGLVPDLNRVIGAVLNSIGIGSMTGGQLPGVQVSGPVNAPQANVTAPQGNITAPQGNITAPQGNVTAPQGNITAPLGNITAPQGNDSQSHIGNQQYGHTFTGQSLPQIVQIPLGAAIAVPSINSPIPDSLHTLTEFMNRMELVFSQNGYPPNQSPSSAADPSAVQLPTNSRGLSTPEALSTILHHAERLFGGHVIAALSQIAGRLEQEGSSSDPTVRGHVQTESVFIGQAMQHLGALLLELGRTVLTLRMGQSPAESVVNAGPAVYISPAGPNPIMVQPFPLQTSSLFGGSTSVPPNPGGLGAFGVGNAPRHVNIHIHAVGSRATNGDGAQGERGSGADSGPSRVLPVRSMMATAVPSRPAVMSVSSMAQPGQSESSTAPQQSVVSGAENDTGSTQLGISSSSGMTLPVPFPVHDVPGREDKMSQGQSSEMSNREGTTIVNSGEEPSQRLAGGSGNVLNKPDASVSAGAAQRSGQELSSPDECSSVPLGLGLGGLQPKRRTKQSRTHGNTGNGSTSNSENILQSLASLATRGNDTAVPSGIHSDGGVMGTVGMGNQNVDGQPEIANAMSHVLQSPALNGLLSGVSQRSGVGSPDMLRNMLQQLTQSPAMINTVSQIAQQIDTQDLGSMFSGQGGGMDLSRMFQQMMPIVSQALGGVSALSQRNPNIAEMPDSNSTRRVATPTNENIQIDLHEVAQRIENNNSPAEIFRSLVQNTVGLNHSGSIDQSLVDELCSTEGLSIEFMEMLRKDVSQRFQDKQGQ